MLLTEVLAVLGRHMLDVRVFRLGLLSRGAGLALIVVQTILSNHGLVPECKN